MTKIVAILNVTPDSFSDGGKFNSLESAVTRVAKMIEEGADVIDIGAESTRPQATPIGSQEEWSRLEKILPAVIAEVKKSPRKIKTSIDSYHFETLVKAWELGVDVINDVKGLSDERIVNFIAAKNVETVLMHNEPCLVTPPSLCDTPSFLRVTTSSLSVTPSSPCVTPSNDGVHCATTSNVNFKLSARDEMDPVIRRGDTGGRRRDTEGRLGDTEEGWRDAEERLGDAGERQGDTEYEKVWGDGRSLLVNKNIHLIPQMLAWGEKKISELEKRNVKKSQLIFDVGIGFGKDALQSIRVLKNINEFKKLGLPLYVGHSKKSFLDQVKIAGDRAEKTLVVSQYLIQKNVDFLRVHDVAAHAKILCQPLGKLSH